MSNDACNFVLETPDEIKKLLSTVKRVAVLGIKTEQQADAPAFYVAEYLVGAGLDVIPVPVYYPDVTRILGKQVYRKVADIPGDVDLVDIFRRPADIDAHIDDIIAKKPKAVWFQSGIRNEGAAKRFADAGIQVVQDRCLMVDHRRFAR